MPNISKKVAYDVKEASNQSLSKSARKHYAENAQAGSKSDSKHGSWISKHMSQLWENINTKEKEETSQ